MFWNIFSLCQNYHLILLETKICSVLTYKIIFFKLGMNRSIGYIYKIELLDGLLGQTNERFFFFITLHYCCYMQLVMMDVGVYNMKSRDEFNCGYCFALKCHFGRMNLNHLLIYFRGFIFFYTIKCFKTDLFF